VVQLQDLDRLQQDGAQRGTGEELAKVFHVERFRLGRPRAADQVGRAQQPVAGLELPEEAPPRPFAE